MSTQRVSSGADDPGAVYTPKEQLLLDVEFGNKTALSLTGKDETFTCQTLETLIAAANGHRKDYIFILTEDDTEKISFFDGRSFCEWISKSEDLRNPLTNLTINNGRFYIIPKDVSLKDIKRGVPAVFLCDLEEYLDFDGSSFFYHLIDRSNPENEHEALLEYHLILDILLGQGIMINDQEAFKCAEAQAARKNPYCALLMAFLCREGIGIDQKLPSRGDEYYELATTLFGSIELTASHYADLEALLKERNKQKEVTDKERYNAQKLYSFLKT